MANVNRESLGNLHDKIKVTLQQQDYMPVFEKDVKSFSRRANIPGFRKGKVPAGVIRKMHGKELYADAVIRSAEKELRDYLSNEKIELLGQPLIFKDDNNLPELDIHNPKEYEFLFEVGLKPEINISFPSDTSAILYKVKVKPEDIDNRVDGFQTQFGKLNDTEVVEGADNIVYLTINEINEDGSKKEGGFNGNTSLYVKVFREEFQNELKGKKKDDVLKTTLNKAVDSEKYPGVFQNLNIDVKDTVLTNAPVELKIDSVHTLDKAELNEDLFKKAYPSKEINSEEEFRKAIEEDEQSYWDKAANNYLNHNLLHLLTEIPVSLPEDFLKRSISGTAGGDQVTKEEKENSYKSLADQLKWSMITEKIIKDQNLTISREELRKDAAEELKNYFGGANLMGGDENWLDEYVDRLLADQKQTEQRMDKLMSEKVFDWARTQIKVEEKEISQDDFQKEIEDHQHHH